MKTKRMTSIVGPIAFLFFLSLAAASSAHASEQTGFDCVEVTPSIKAIVVPSANRCPTADAGPDLPLVLNMPSILDGSGSSDIDHLHGQLRYTWNLVSAPKGSVAQAADPQAFKTSFTADLPGTYVFELTVEDSAGAQATDTVRFSTDNIVPLAKVGHDQTVEVGQFVTLDAVRSYDLNQDNLTYRWRVLEAPQNSQLQLLNTDRSQANVILDQEGDYVFGLQVSDGKSHSEMEEVRVSTINSAPIAQAGRKRVLAPNSTLVLDASGSSDIDGDALSFHWALLSAPKGFHNEISDKHSQSPNMRLGAEGLYLFQLVVDDGQLLSKPAQVQVEVRADRLSDVDVEQLLSRSQRAAGFGDLDGDGVSDLTDNCVVVVNPDQRDTDGDGIGNICDADLNNDGVVNFTDVTLFRDRFLSTDPDADFDGNGFVNFIDYTILTQSFLLPPGPAGVTIWVSLVDGDWNDPSNWQPQTVPTANTVVIADVGTSVTITRSGGSILARNLLMNENLVGLNSTIAVESGIELGGTITCSSCTVQNTEIVPSLAGAGTLSFNSGTHNFDGVALGVDATLNNGALINVSNGMVLNATALLNAPTSPTGFTFLTDQTLAGSGTVTLNGVGNSIISEPRLLSVNGTMLTIGPDITVNGGKGTIGSSGSILNILGDIDASIGGESIRIIGSEWSAVGTISASNGGNIEFAGNFNNLGNVLALDTAGGSSNLLNGSSMSNAMILGTAGTNITFNTGTTALQAISYTGDISMVNGALSNVSGGLTINGNLLIDAPNSPTGLTFTESQTLGGNLNVTFDGVGNAVVTEPRLFPVNGTTLTIAETVTINGGKGTIGGSGAELIVLGQLNANIAGEELVVGGINWSANQSFTAANDGIIRMFGALDNGGESLDVDTADGFFRLTSGSVLANATFEGTPGSILEVPAGTTTFSAMSFAMDLDHANGALTNVNGGLTIDGIATINAPTSPTGFTFTETQTLGGNAEIVINAVANTVVSEPRLRPANNTTLTIAETVTISGGKGTIGNASAGLNFLGQLNANVEDQELVIGGTNWLANNAFTASNGGIIRLFGSLDNGGQALSIDTADGLLSATSGTSLSNATFNGTAGSELEMLTGTSGFTAMVFNMDVRHLNGALTNVAGGLEINGDSTIVAPTSPTGYTFVETQSLLGAANIVMDSASNPVVSEPRLFPVNGTTLTIGSNVAISGAVGTIGNTSGSIDLLGSITATNSGSVMRVAGSDWSGTGTLAATGGGILRIAGTLDNANQTLNLDGAGGIMDVESSVIFKDINLVGTAGTDVVFGAGTRTFNNLIANVDMTLNNGALANVLGDLTLNGTLNIVAPTLPTGLTFTEDMLLTGNANIVFNGVGNTVISEPRLRPSNGVTVTFDTGVTISGAVGTIGNSTSTIVNNGTISADGGLLVIDQDGAGSVFNNSGLLEAVNGGILELRSPNQNTGTLHVGPEGTITSNIGFTLNDVIVDVDATGAGFIIIDDFQSYGGTLTVNAVNGFSPMPGFSTVIVSHVLSAGAFTTVNSNGLGAGLNFVPSYDSTQVIVDVN